jgi:hypothetical protein
MSALHKSFPRSSSLIVGTLSLFFGIGIATADTKLPACSTAAQKKLPGPSFQCRNGNKPQVQVVDKTAWSSCDNGGTKQDEPLRGTPVCRDEENDGYKVTIRVQTANCGQ